MMKATRPKTLARRAFLSTSSLALVVPTMTEAQFSYKTFTDKTVGISAYTGTASSVSIPRTHDGMPVKFILHQAFYNCITVTNVTIPDEITFIEWRAFGGCGLTSITFPRSETEIRNEMFYGCRRLSSITLPTNLVAIGELAFHGCTDLATVAIPSSVTYIGYGAFAGCRRLTAISIESGNDCYSSVDGVLLDKRQTVVIKCPEGKLGRYSIPNTVTEIGQSAFGGCAFLTDVTIPDGLTVINTGAFNGCSNLRALRIPKGITDIPDFAFNECLSFTNARIPESVTSIGEYAFSECTNMETVTVGPCVTRIDYQAFTLCTKLTGIYFLGDAPRLGPQVFEDSPRVTIYHLPGTKGWSSTFGGRPTALWTVGVQERGQPVAGADAGSRTSQP